MIWPPHFEDITFAAQSLPCGLPLPWFQKNMMVSHLGENPVRKWSQRGGGQWFPSLWSPVFLWKWNILPSFIKKKEKEGERESQSDWYCQGMFLYSPTTSLLPPSESFRIKKRPFTGEDLGIRRKKVNLQRLTNSDCQFLIGYICEHKFITVATRKIQNPRRLYTFLWELTIKSCKHTHTKSPTNL